jgi:hypothetical protein
MVGGIKLQLADGVGLAIRNISPFHILKTLDDITWKAKNASEERNF